MEANDIIRLLKQNPLYHRRLTVIVSKLGLAPDIDTFIREYCAPDGWQTPYNDVDYQECVDACEGYRDKGIEASEMPGIFFLRFGVAIDPPSDEDFPRFSVDVLTRDQTVDSHRGLFNRGLFVRPDGGLFNRGLFVRPDESGKHAMLYSIFYQPVIELDRQPVLSSGRMPAGGRGHEDYQDYVDDPDNHVIYHEGVKNIIQFAQRCPLDQKARVLL